MKLLQLNVWMGKLTWQATRFIEQEKPDIICLQEAFQADANIKFPDKVFNCLDLIQEASGLEYCFFSPISSMDVADGTVEMGNAILSRYPFESTETIFTHGEYQEHHTALNHIENARNMQIVELKIDDQDLTVINHHAHWEKTPMGSEVSIERMKQVANRARQVEGPLIFAGDLNLLPESEPMRLFDGWLEDLVAKSDATTTLSKLGQPFDVVCDHIFVNGQIKVNEFAVKSVMVSDHLPVVLEFDIKE